MRMTYNNSHSIRKQSVFECGTTRESKSIETSLLIVDDVELTINRQGLRILIIR